VFKHDKDYKKQKIPGVVCCPFHHLKALLSSYADFSKEIVLLVIRVYPDKQNKM